MSFPKPPADREAIRIAGRAIAEKVAPPKELAEDVMNAVAAQLRDQFDRAPLFPYIVSTPPSLVPPHPLSFRHGRRDPDT